MGPFEIQSSALIIFGFGVKGMMRIGILPFDMDLERTE